MKSAQQQNKTERCVATVIKPLRAFQFLVVLLLFVFAVYMCVMVPTPINALACILLIVLSGVYVFALAIELIRQFAGGGFHIIPMFAFSLLGVFLFGVAGIFLIFAALTGLVIIIIVATALSLLAALIFLIDITITLIFWKKRCSVCKRCCNYDMAKFVPPKIDSDTMLKWDVTTSVSDIRLPLIEEPGAIPDHSYRKVEEPRRRTYIDRPTSVESLIHTDVAGVQTDPMRISVVESQTPQLVTREAPIQTLSKCEFCHQQLQGYVQEPSAAPCLQYPPQWSCPAIVQFVRGGGTPCCSGCKCATGTTQPQQSNQTKKGNPSSSRTKLTSEATQQVANSTNPTENTEDMPRLTAETVTKLTLASFYVKPDKRIQTLPMVQADSVYTRKIDMEENAKLTDGEAKRGIAKKNSKSPEFEIVEETIVQQTKESYPLNLETEIPVLKEISGEPLAESTKNRGEESRLEDIEEYNNDKLEEDGENKIERSKGGGEDRLYRQFMHAIEQESTTSESPRHSVATQMDPISPSRIKQRMFPHLKLNRVDPVDDKNRIYTRAERETSRAAYTSQEDEPPESPISSSRQVRKVCSLCQREKSLIPTSDNSRYYTVFKDRKGRYFCEFCAPPNCKKVVSRIDSADSRKVRCANCRYSFRGRRNETNVSRSDACPRCGQSEKRVTSPSSM